MDAMTPCRVHLFVSGRVQGVAYRVHAQQRARQLGLVGWVRNLPDGRVEAWAEGPRSALEALSDWCECGPAAARVEEVDRTWGDGGGEYEGFEIRR